MDPVIARAISDIRKRSILADELDAKIIELETELRKLRKRRKALDNQ